MAMRAWESLRSWLLSQKAINNKCISPDEIKRLDLSGRAIESLPESIGLLESLVALNLSNNELSELPGSMRQLHQLSNLDLRRNRFERLPELLASLPLRSLNVSSNRLTEVSVLRDCPDLRVLDLGSNELKSLGGCLRENNELRTLNVSCNYIHSFDGCLEVLQNAERLNLSGNFLTQLPSAVENLKVLELLDLADNRIDSIDEAFFGLEVESVDLSSNRLSAMTLHGLGALEELTLDNNPFESLAIAEEFAPYLRQFSCENCQLTTFLLPPSRKLEALCYASNAIEDVPEAIGRYEHLAELDLEDNAIRELPDALANLVALQTLYIVGNPLSDAAKKIIDIKHPDICDLKMKHDITIEKATLADLPEMASLLEILFALEADFTFDFEKQLAGITRLFHYEGTDLLVARHEERVVGMITMQRLISSAAGDFIGQIEDLVVLEAYRKMGVGSRLINKMRFIAQTYGYKRVQLAADIDNENALQFYTRRGFHRTNLTVFHFKNT
jgi:Leucine-rich repeat (LRR) protein